LNYDAVDKPSFDIFGLRDESIEAALAQFREIANNFGTDIFSGKDH